MKIPETPPSLLSILEELNEAGTVPKVFGYMASSAPENRDIEYNHWDKIKYKTPPEGLTHKEWWATIKLNRNSNLREVSLLDKNGKSFKYTLPDQVLKKLHEIDRDASGRIEFPEKIANQDSRDRYIQSSLIEEAITSSQLEGAATTREVAKEMIRAGRKPLSEGEKMILNNFKAMKHIVKIKGKEITPSIIEELHGILTRNILDPKTTPYRVPGDGIKVFDNEKNIVLHDPPDANEIEDRLIKFCAFANNNDDASFMHPVLKAIILHFWMAYDHPFKDGNGRTARALFYWYMLSQGFWLFEFVSISTVLKKAPVKYAKAFLKTETDDNDLTYFVIHQLDVVCKAIDSLYNYLQKKTNEFKETQNLLKPSSNINHRQIALLGHALKHPSHNYTIESHRKSHNVTYQTARTDLLDLEGKKLLIKMKRSNAFVFRPTDNLSYKIRNL